MTFRITSETLTIVLIMMLALSIRVYFTPSFSFGDDESIYTYSYFAISKGIVPYREIQLPSPPLSHLIYAFIIKIVGPDLYSLRLSNIVFFVATVYLTYLLAKMLLRGQKGAGILGLLSAGLYAFYPLLIPYSIAVGPEFILTFFALSSVIIYVAASRSKNNIPYFLVGVLMGLAVLTKLTAVYFLGALLLYHAGVMFLDKKYRAKISQAMTMLLGFSAPIAAFLVWVTFSCGALRQFYLQAFYWQTVRFPVSFGERLATLQFSSQFYVVFVVLGVLGSIFLARMAREPERRQLILPVWLSSVTLVAIILITPVIFVHYFFFLTPYFAILSSACFFYIGSLLYSSRQNRLVAKYKYAIFSVLLILVVLSASEVAIWQVPLAAPYFQPVESPWTRVEFYTGHYVATIDSSEKMWTSEGAIALFAGKLIVTPNSTDWPLPAFYADSFGYYWNQPMGDEMKDYKHGVVSLSQFIESWEKEQVKVIIIIRGTGWIPYPDELMWGGIYGQEGVANYIQSKYELRQAITIPEVPYTYEVWVRR